MNPESDIDNTYGTLWSDRFYEDSESPGFYNYISEQIVILSLRRMIPFYFATLFHIGRMWSVSDQVVDAADYALSTSALNWAAEANSQKTIERLIAAFRGQESRIRDEDQFDPRSFSDNESFRDFHSFEDRGPSQFSAPFRQEDGEFRFVLETILEDVITHNARCSAIARNWWSAWLHEVSELRSVASAIDMYANKLTTTRRTTQKTSSPRLWRFYIQVPQAPLWHIMLRPLTEACIRIILLDYANQELWREMVDGRVQFKEPLLHNAAEYNDRIKLSISLSLAMSNPDQSDLRIKLINDILEYTHSHANT